MWGRALAPDRFGPAIRRALDDAAPENTSANQDRAQTEEPTRQALEEALAANGGSVTATARALGVCSRFVLYRLIKKHRLDPESFRRG